MHTELLSFFLFWLNLTKQPQLRFEAFAINHFSEEMTVSIKINPICLYFIKFSSVLELTCHRFGHVIMFFFIIIIIHS